MARETCSHDRSKSPITKGGSGGRGILTLPDALWKKRRVMGAGDVLKVYRGKPVFKSHADCGIGCQGQIPFGVGGGGCLRMRSAASKREKAAWWVSGLVWFHASL